MISEKNVFISKRFDLERMLLVLLVALLSGYMFGFIGYMIGRAVQIGVYQKQAVALQKMSATGPLLCKNVGILPKDDYLTTYVVKKTDTLQSIAKSELGSSDKTSDIIEVNSMLYPSLLSSDALSPGWALFLPPTLLHPIPQGGISGTGGYISDIEQNEIFIRTSSVSEKGFMTNGTIYPKNKAAFLTRNECVVIITANNDSSTALYISPQ